MKRKELEIAINDIRKETMDAFFADRKALLDRKPKMTADDREIEMSILLSELSAAITAKTLERFGLVQVED